MGLSQSSVLSNRSIDLSNYTAVERRSDGLILRDHLSNKTYILRDHFIADKQQLYRVTKELSLLNSRQYKHILNVVAVERQTTQSICSQSYRISFVVEITTKTLLDEIRLRERRKSRFLISELLELMCWLVQATRQAVGTSTLTIMPKRINITDNGQLKLRSSSLDDPQQTDLEQYYSPERFQGSTWNRAQTTRISQQQKEFVFGIGLTILSSATLEDCIDCYDFKEYSLRVSLIEEKVQQCSQVYSPLFATILAGALEFNPNRRTSLSELEASLKTFSAQLYDLRLSRMPSINDLSMIHECPHPTSQQQAKSESESESSANDDSTSPRGSLIDNSTQSSLGEWLKMKRVISDQPVETSLLLSEGKPSTIQRKHSKNDQRGTAAITGPSHQQCIQDDITDGKTQFFYSDNKLAYDGECRSKQFHGQGIHFNEVPQPLFGAYDYRDFNKLGHCWLFYRGSFEMNVKEGEGVLVLTNGQQFKGSFHKGCIEGKGEFYRQDGTVVRSTWIANRVVEP